MNVLDLFSGRGGWHTAFKERGHNIVTLDSDVDGRFGADFRDDILTIGSLLKLEKHGPFDVILASPPCTAFSVAAMGKNWTRYMGRNPVNGRTEWLIEGPKHERARKGMEIAHHTFLLIDNYVSAERTLGRNVLYVIENPIGALRVMPFVITRKDRDSTWYCQWEEARTDRSDKPRAKPTDLWTNFGGKPFPMCGPGRPDHEAAPRGAKTGTQGLATAADRSLVPYRLSAAFCFAAETDGVVRPELADGLRAGEAVGISVRIDPADLGTGAAAGATQQDLWHEEKV